MSPLRVAGAAIRASLPAPTQSNVTVVAPVLEGPESARSQGQSMAGDHERHWYYCWSRRAHPDAFVDEVKAKDACHASEILIHKIRASTPYPKWTAAAAAARRGLVRPFDPQEMRLCIDYPGNDYIVAPLDWNPDEDITHAQVRANFTPDEFATFQRIWAAMKRGPNEEWY